MAAEITRSTRISEEEIKEIQKISEKTGISMKKLMDIGARHVIREYKEGRFGVLLETKGG